MLAAGLFKYGVTHYKPPAPRKSAAIAAPVRPEVKFHCVEETTIDLHEEDALRKEDLC